jgi:hypothetical protein
MPGLSVARCAAMMFRPAAEAATGAGGGSAFGGIATRKPPRALQSAAVRGVFTQLPSMHNATAESGGVGAAVGSVDGAGGGGETGDFGIGASCARAKAGAPSVAIIATLATTKDARLVMGLP